MSDDISKLSDRQLLELVFQDVKDMRDEFSQKFDQIELRLTRIESGQKRLNDRIYESEMDIDLLKKAK